MCQDACTEGEYQPDCKDDKCEGEDGKCTVGSQKGCDCKMGCPEGIDAVGARIFLRRREFLIENIQPLCTNEDCNGGQSGQCGEVNTKLCT